MNKIEYFDMSRYIKSKVFEFTTKHPYYEAIPEGKTIKIATHDMGDLFLTILKDVVVPIVHNFGEPPNFYIKDGLIYHDLEQFWDVIVALTQKFSKMTVSNNDFKVSKDYVLYELNKMVDNKQIKIRKMIMKGHFLNSDGTVWDLKNKCFVEDVKDFVFLSPKKQTFKGVFTHNEYLDVIEDYVKLVSNEDEEQAKFIMQLLFSAIEGYGRKSMVLMKSTGGLGKSTFATLLTRISSHPVSLNVNLIDNDNQVKRVSINTTAVIGDDLNEKVRLFANPDSRLKQFISGNVYSYVAKWETGKNNVFNGLLFQPVNEFPKMYGEDDAIVRRVICTEWLVQKNKMAMFIKKHPNFLKLLETQSFIEAIVEYVLTRVDYFEEFDIQKTNHNIVETTLGENDMIEQHISYLQDIGVFEYNSYLPYNLYYEHYKEYIKLNYPNSRCVTQRTYVKVAVRISKKLGLIEGDGKATRLIGVTLNNFNPFILCTNVEMVQLLKYKKGSGIVNTIVNLDNKPVKCYQSKTYKNNALDKLYKNVKDVLNDKPSKLCEMLATRVGNGSLDGLRYILNSEIYMHLEAIDRLSLS